LQRFSNKAHATGCVFLTKAQEEVVAALYNGTFEGTE
jgi:hypothetical protein